MPPPDFTYQVYAVQRMVKCIDDDDGNGFIWHTAALVRRLLSEDCMISLAA